jgi:hypothetical protein
MELNDSTSIKRFFNLISFLTGEDAGGDNFIQLKCKLHHGLQTVSSQLCPCYVAYEVSAVAFSNVNRI